jgi:hypothetical protein
MARKCTGRPVGRPHKPIDQTTFEELCKLHCTHSEICSTLHSARETVEDWCLRTYREDFSSAYKRFSEMGKPSLRRNQYKAAQKGNPTMLIWLGKQWLGQRDREEEEKKSPYQAAIDERHENMMLRAENDKLKAQLNANKPECES